MEDGQRLALSGAGFPILKPVPYRHFEIRQTPALVERQEGTACSNGHDRHSRRALDHLGIHDDQRAVG
jgi:hypothetical protein